MKKFVSVLLVLCCLMASCVPALAAVDVWSSDRVIDCIKRAMSDSFDDYSVTRVSSEEFQADIVYDISTHAPRTGSDSAKQQFCRPESEALHKKYTIKQSF